MYYISIIIVNNSDNHYNNNNNKNNMIIFWPGFFGYHKSEWQRGPVDVFINILI